MSKRKRHAGSCDAGAGRVVSSCKGPHCALFRLALGMVLALISADAAAAQDLRLPEAPEPAHLPRLQPSACPTEGRLRVPAAASLEKFRSLEGCRTQAILASPGMAPRRLRAIAIPGRAEEPAGRDEEPEAAPGGGGALPAALLITAALTPDLPFMAHRHAAPTSRKIVRIASVRAEFDLVRFGPAALRAPAAAAGPARLLQRDAILALAPRSYRTRFDQLIAAAARRHAIDPLLLHAVIRQESNYAAHALSRAGAVGLMQIMPATGARLGQAHGHLFDPMRNLDTGARLLRILHRRFRGNLDLMLAAYNAGEAAVARYGNRVPPIAETRDYVRLVKAHYAALASENGLFVGGS